MTARDSSETKGDEREGASALSDALSRFLRRVPRQERARSVVTAILEAADERLDVADAGPLQRIFARAGVAAGSFYEYFGTRENLLSAVIERVTEKNFESFLQEVDAAFLEHAEMEQGARAVVEAIARGYLTRPQHLRTVIRLADRLGLLPRVATERDRFADAVAERFARYAPDTAPEVRRAAMRAVADAVTGIVVVAVFRSAEPAVDSVARAASDAAWGILRSHLERPA